MINPEQRRRRQIMARIAGIKDAAQRDAESVVVMNEVRWARGLHAVEWMESDLRTHDEELEVN